MAPRDRAWRSAGVIFGVAVGVLYAVTTISGPPLALALNNQGLAAVDFRAGLGLIRLAESGMTTIAYLQAGFFTADTIQLVMVILPAALIGIPLGAAVARRLHAETFRRVCMSVDAWIVAFGIAVLLRTLFGVDVRAAAAIVAAIGSVDAWLLYRFFSVRRAVAHVS